MMTELRIIRTNKKERTITIKKTTDKGTSIYKSYPLEKNEFNYYKNNATQHDLFDFLRSDDYYMIK